MKPGNPYRPAQETTRPVQERFELPLSFPVFATLDIIASGAIGLIAAGTWFGFENRTFAGVFVAMELMAAASLAVSLLATAIGLVLKRPFVWLLFVVSQCIVAFWVLFTYLGLMYVLIDTWGVSHMMWKGGDPQNVAIVTLVFVVVQSLTAIPIVILIRNKSDGRSEHATQFHGV